MWIGSEFFFRVSYLITDHFTSYPLKTNSWYRVLLEKLVTQLVKKFLAFYGTRRFIAGFRRVRYWSLSWATWIQSTSLHPVAFDIRFKVLPKILQFDPKLEFPSPYRLLFMAGGSFKNRILFLWIKYWKVLLKLYIVRHNFFLCSITWLPGNVFHFNHVNTRVSESYLMIFFPPS
jgi:hypothetical protein